MDLSKKKHKIIKDKLGNDIKIYKLTKEELKKYLMYINRGKKNDSTKENI